MRSAVIFFILIIYVTNVFSSDVPHLRSLRGEIPTIREHVMATRLVSSSLASRGQFPHQAMIIADSAFVCGGSLISGSWVLTSGLCIYMKSSFKITLGVINVSEIDGQSVVIVSRETIIHEDFNRYTFHDDIGLVHIPNLNSFSAYISPVKLPHSSDSSNQYGKSKVDISGWGGICQGEQSVKELRYTVTHVISNTECLYTYPNYAVPDSKMCTQDAGNGGITDSDSGDPVVIVNGDGSYTQVGIASFSSSNVCFNTIPSAHTRVTSYLGWIHQKTGISTTTT